MSEAAAPDEAAEARFRRRQHEVIRRITGDYESFKFNTAVAALMEWLNYLCDAREEEAVGPSAWREAIETFTLLLAPIAPFITEEVWQALLGHRHSVHRRRWPSYDPAQIERAQLTVAVQVNGRLRDTISVPAEIDEQRLEQVALESPNVQRHIEGRPIQRTIVVPGRLINIVV